MATTVSGIVSDTQGNPLPGLQVTISYLRQLVGANGGAAVENTRVFVTDGAGLLEMPDLLPGHYSIAVSVPTNSLTALPVVLRRGTMTVLNEGTQSLESALDEATVFIEPSALQLAIEAKLAAEAAADAAEGFAASVDPATFVKRDGTQGMLADLTMDGNRVIGDLTGNVIGDLTGNTVTTSNLTVGTVNYPSTGPLSNRNKIINGAMVIDQRNAGAAVTPTAAATSIYPTLDRWNVLFQQASKLSLQQSAVAPIGFTNSLLATSLSAHAIVSGDRYVIRQNIEGFNAADLGWGSADAQPVTVSFWVRSSLTGSFGGFIGNSAINRSYPFAYTISAANTWEYKTLTIEGDTTGTWLVDNGIGVRLGFSLGAGSDFSGTAGAWASSQIFQPTGSTSVVSTNGATWQITGVQLEAGTVATPFEHRSFGQELALCQRYFEVTGYRMQLSGNYASTVWKTSKRAAPTLTLSGTGNIQAISGAATESFVLTDFASSSYDAIVTGSAEL
jgi:hypothetical protein